MNIASYSQVIHPVSLFLRWRSLCGRLGVDESSMRKAFGRIVDAYGINGGYHSINCVRSRLCVVDSMDDASDLLQLAVWLRDGKYSQRHVDKRRGCAEFACSILLEIGRSRFSTEVVSSAVATHYDVFGKGPLAQTVFDVCNAVLGADRALYDIYVLGIRHEFHWMYDTDFFSVRKAYLNSLLDSERIYWTKRFRGRLESKARANIARELEGIGRKELLFSSVPG